MTRRRARSILGPLPLVALLASDLQGRLAAQDPPSARARSGDAARDADGRATIPEVIVTPADLPPQDVERTPIDDTAGRDVISHREIEKAGTTSIQELLRRSPGVMITEETGSESLPNVALRGVATDEGPNRSVNVSMLADGIPLSPAPYSHPGSSLFAFTLERLYAIDVQKGGASVRYGPNNVSGVINFLSRPIPDVPTYELGVRYDSWSNASFYNAYGATHDRFGYLLETVYKDGDSYRDHGEYTLQNYALKTRYAFDERVRSLLQIEYFDDDTHLSDGLSLAEYEEDPEQSSSPRNEFFGHQQRYNHKLEVDLSDDTRFDLISYYYEGVREFRRGSPLHYGEDPDYVQATPRPMQVWAVQPQITHRYDAFGVPAEVHAGVRYLDENQTRRTERFFPDGHVEEISSPRFDYHAYSAFVESSFYLGDWTIRPGLRLEHVDVKAVGDDGFVVERDFSEVLPALSASYLITPEWSVYANAQTSFQPPPAQTIEISPNPQEIESQEARVYEIGTRVEREDRLFAADLTLYYIDYKDRLLPDPDEFDVYFNSGRSRHQGVELVLDGDLSRLGIEGVTVWTASSYNDSEFRNGEHEGNEVPGAPHWLFSWGAEYEHAPTGLGAGFDGLFADESFADVENTVEISADGTRGEKPSYVLWNAHAGWRGTVAEGLELSMLFKLRNVFDEEYFDVRPGQGIHPGMPFSYGVELGLKVRL